MSNNKNTNYKSATPSNSDNEQQQSTNNGHQKRQRLIATEEEDIISKDEVVQNVTLTCNKTHNGVLHKNDVVSIVFSYLKCRDMGKASMTCKDWNNIFKSDGVQTKAVKDDIRWAKYAHGDCLQVDQVSNMKYYLCHVLDDGRWVAFRRGQNNDENEVEDGHYMDLYTIEGETIDTLKVSYFVTEIVSSGILLYLSYGHSIQAWCVNDDSDNSSVYPLKYTSIVPMELANDHSISSIAAPPKGAKVFYVIGTSMKVWYTQKDGEDAIKTMYSNIPTDNDGNNMEIICKYHYTVLRNKKHQVVIWNHDTKDIKVINSDYSFFDSFTIEEIGGVHRLLTCDVDGVIEIYSIDDRKVLCSCLSSYDGPCFGRFSQVDGRLFAAAKPLSTDLDDPDIKVWKVSVGDEDKDENEEKDSEKIRFTLQETIRHAKQFEFITNMSVLPNGRLFTCGCFSGDVEPSNDDYFDPDEDSDFDDDSNHEVMPGKIIIW